MTSSSGGLLRHLGLRSATAIVVANIIGAGIFTTTGFQAADLGNPGLIFSVWILGGFLALCGALCYAELGAAMPEAGAEYAYLRNTYGPSWGTMSAFVSLFAGFSAPIAAALKSFVRYALHFFPSLDTSATIFGRIAVADLIAIGLVWILIAIHFRGMRGGIAFNDLITLFKVCGIVAIILCAAAIGEGRVEHFTTVSSTYETLTSQNKVTGFATSLIFVMFCYSGWNASAYMAAEMTDPQKTLPKSLLGGTAVVILLYLGLNAVYFYGADVDTLAGKVEVGQVAAEALFGGVGVGLVTVVLCVSIFASASAMTIAGPRVYYAFGKDFAPFRLLANTDERTGAPRVALLLQGAVTSLIILSGTIDQIQQYAGFTLSLFASLAVSCVIFLRIKKPEMERPFRAWGYPLTPLFFLAVMGWTMYWSYQGRPAESRWGLITVAVGGLSFYVATKLRGQRDET